MTISPDSTLDDLIRKEGKLTVLIASDDPDFSTVARDIFLSDIYDARTVSKRNVDKSILRNGTVAPDIILFNISGEFHRLDTQLDLMRKVGSKYPSAELIVTLDDEATSRIFGSRQRDEAYLSIWNQMARDRDFAPRDFRITYPRGNDVRAKQETYREGLTRLLNSISPATLEKLYELRRDRTALKLFASDYDGTLLKDDGTISNEDLGALRRLGQQIPIVFASGRPPISMESTAQLINPDSNWYIIAHNGALVLDRRRNILYERPVETKDAIALLNIFEEVRRQRAYQGNILLNYFFGNHGNDIFSIQDDKIADLRDEYQQRNEGKVKYTFLPEIADLIRIAETTGPHKALIIVRYDKGLISGFRKSISDLLDSSDTLAFSPSQPHYFEFTHAEATKGNALMTIIRKLHIHTRNVAYAGNSINDVGALRMVGYPIVVKNAPSDVYKALGEAANRVKHVNSNNKDGVAEGIAALQSKVYRPF